MTTLPSAIRKSSQLSSRGPQYKTLLKRVKKIFLEGQARVEHERLRTYWETGRLVNDHVKKYSHGNDAYGDEIVLSLSNDIAVSETVLYRCLKFHQIYPDFKKVARGPLFKWSHYRKLITIADDKKRQSLERAVSKNAWNAQELALRVQQDTANSKFSAGKISSSRETEVKGKPLTPLRGQLYTYRLVERPSLAADAVAGLLIDLGFGVYHEADGRLITGFVKEDIVESRPKEDAYRFYKTGRTAKDLYTYAAYVERVIDADTVKVRLDLGFHVWVRQTLRLRDLDAPELGTSDGDEARAFVRSLLKEAQLIIVRTSRSDKYDRYLADIYVPRDGSPDPATDIYLNNLLLETGRAKRMG